MASYTSGLGADKPGVLEQRQRSTVGTQLTSRHFRLFTDPGAGQNQREGKLVPSAVIMWPLKHITQQNLKTGHVQKVLRGLGL